jgi:orotate phosphoribosyltransferase
MTEREALASLLRERSVSFGDFLLASGQRSHYYIDARKTTMSAAGQRLIGRLGLDAIRTEGWTPTAVGGLTMGADPVAYAIARASADAPPPIDASVSVRRRRTTGPAAGSKATSPTAPRWW